MSTRPIIRFCLLCSALIVFSTPALFAGAVEGGGSIAVDSNALASSKFTTIAAGPYRSLALKSDGSMVGWGDGGLTALDGNNFIAIATGYFHSLALRSDGSIVSWGFKGYGLPKVPDGNNFIAIAAGYWHSLALKSDGSIVGWGYGSLGPPTVPEGNNFTAISAGYYHSLALKSDGSIIAWKNIKSMWSQYYHALKTDGAVGVVLGSSQAKAPAGHNFIAVAAGGYHSLALKSDGSIVGWGYNAWGQATAPKLK